MRGIRSLGFRGKSRACLPRSTAEAGQLQLPISNPQNKSAILPNFFPLDWALLPRYLGQPHREMASIRSFKIDVPDSAIERLHQKLEITNIPDELEGADWEYGAAL